MSSRTLPWIAAAAAMLLALGPAPKPVGHAPATPQDAAVVPLDPPADGARFVTGVPCVIDQPGLYVLSADVYAADNPEHGYDFGIMIRADDVVLDLGGHALVGAPGTAVGISVVPPERRQECLNVCVRHGAVRNWGAHGLDLRLASGCRLQDLSVVGNGRPQKPYHGAFVGDDVVISDCSFDRNALDGLHAGSGARVADCGAADNGGAGLAVGALSALHDCTALDNRGDGFVLEGYGVSLRDCSAGGNTRNGVRTGPAIGSGIGVGAQIHGVVAAGNDQSGVLLGEGCAIDGCTLVNNGGAGIEVVGNDNRIDANHIALNGIALQVSGHGNLLARNTLAGNHQSIDAGEDNVVGVLVSHDSLAAAESHAHAPPPNGAPPYGSPDYVPPSPGTSAPTINTLPAWANIVF